MKLLRAFVITVGVLAGAYIATQVLMIGLVFVTLTGGPGCWFAPHPDHFVQGVWIEADPDGECGSRSAMVDDLLANHLRVGMTRAEVEALLGPPDDPEYGWVLGCWIDCDWVMVEYDSTGRMTQASRYQD